MQFDVRRRCGARLFTAEIDCAADASTAVKTGLAITWALKSGADLRDADLRDADLREADLRDAKLSHADLVRADLRGAGLRGAVLRGAVLCDTDLSHADLRHADLSGALLHGADLSGAVLHGADLSGTTPDGIPVVPDIHAAVYAAASADGALDMERWHCGTTHCRAGWVVTLAGEAGTALERRLGTSAAAALIYQASDPTLERVPSFHASNEAALADMKAHAEKSRNAQ
jgi:hypothetical protein